MFPRLPIRLHASGVYSMLFLLYCLCNVGRDRTLFRITFIFAICSWSRRVLSEASGVRVN
jgi:hypothetical protein